MARKLSFILIADCFFQGGCGDLGGDMASGLEVYLCQLLGQLGLGSFSAFVVRHGDLGTVPRCPYTSLLVQAQEAKTLTIESLHADQGLPRGLQSDWLTILFGGFQRLGLFLGMSQRNNEI
jgi:hypothetical protein